MSLYERIEEDMKDALKNREPERLSVLRMLVSEAKLMVIDKNLKSIGDADIIQILRRQIKQHKDSIEQFKNGLRQDLADKEARELNILESYMPESLSDSEILNIVKAAIAETGAVTKSEMGKVMKIVMEKTKGSADGKIISQIVSGLLK